MRYIRTKSEIYDINDLYVCEEISEKPYATIKGGWCIYKESIVKEADTIEELCDEFVVTADFYNKPNILAKVNSLPIDIDLTTHIIYGAIWTDKGLIYVAKMNDEGELELL